MSLELIPFQTRRMKVGDRFGRLTVRQIGKTARGAHFAVCDCDCGTVGQPIQMARLVNGKTKACGCQNGPSRVTHGLGHTPLYQRWCKMMERCYKPAAVGYANYGGRGICVCERWHDPVNFVEDMTEGFAPDLQLDRMDNDGNYEPSNCRWVSRVENLDNRRNTRLVTYNGKQQSLLRWAAELGMPHKLLAKRLYERNWPVQRALATPVLSRAETAKVANAGRQLARARTTTPGREC